MEEGTNDQYIVRFMGTERFEPRGADVTGKDGLQFFERSLAMITRRNYKTALEHPCGMHSITDYAGEPGSEIQIETVTLPVANDPGLPRRMVNFFKADAAKFDYTHAETHPEVQRTWLDIGFGIPAIPPVGK